MHASFVDRSQEQLYELLFDRVADSDLAPTAGEVVLAAYEGDSELAAALSGVVAAREVVASERPEPGELPGVYLQAIEVEGFRGIGPKAAVRLQPGPGLTLVVGRNGSGKSSFAEAAELALTGANYRWARKSNVWRDSWRNLHQSDPCGLTVQLVVEGQQGATTVRRQWKPGEDLDDAVGTTQATGEPRQPLEDLGWARPLETYRPFLSYAELGTLVDGRPSEMFDALQAILGLDHLLAAERRLNEARKTLDATAKAPKTSLASLLAVLDASDDDRARSAAALLRAKKPDLDALEALATGTDTDDASTTTALAQLRRLEPPDLDAVAGAVARLQSAAAGVAAVAGTEAESAREQARLLRAALEHHDRHGDKECPVCGTGTLDAAWHRDASTQVEALQRAAARAEAAHAERRAAVQAAGALLTPVPSVAKSGAVAGIELGSLQDAWTRWADLRALSDPVALADALEREASALVVQIAPVVEQAEAAHARADAAWKPLATALVEWLATAREASAVAPALTAVKASASWLKLTAAELRDERLRPFATQSAEIWAALRQESSVELGPIRLEGAATRRKVALEVSIDGVDSAALGVMSQGELHALGLALFLPRATAAASPFRFLVIDDPVQAMDPSKVDGLARVLADVARTRQVVVFTHDDRLPEAVRRLQLPGVVWEVVRREASVVEVRKSSDPVARYLDDARALAKTEQLPPTVAARLVPTFCRGAVEAACHEKIRQVRLSAGARHRDVEELLDKAKTTNQLAALALFDDIERGGDVLGRLNGFGGWAADAFRAVRTGAHQAHNGDLGALVADSAKLAEKFRA